MNFFHRAKRAKETEPPAVDPALSPDEAPTKQTGTTVKPIHIDDAQYALLTRALRPGIAPVREEFEVDPTGPDVPVVVDKAGQRRADQPPGAPIV